MKRQLTLCFALLLASFFFQEVGAFADTSRVMILHSSNTNGYLLPCPT